MRRWGLWGVLGLGGVITAACLAWAGPVALAPNFSPDPMVLSGNGGGSVDTGNCGFTNRQPDQRLQVTGDLPYVRITARGGSDLTLLVDGPDGRFCASSLDARGPQMSGYWRTGLYSIYIGTRVRGASAAYRLEITQQR